MMHACTYTYTGLYLRTCTHTWSIFYHHLPENRCNDTYTVLTHPFTLFPHCYSTVADMKRFSSGVTYRCKLSTPVSIPKFIDLTSYTSPETGMLATCYMVHVKCTYDERACMVCDDVTRMVHGACQMYVCRASCMMMLCQYMPHACRACMHGNRWWGRVCDERFLIGNREGRECGRIIAP